jgi:hypothetical protein
MAVHYSLKQGVHASDQGPSNEKSGARTHVLVWVCAASSHAVS